MGDFNINISTKNEVSKQLNCLLKCFDLHLLNEKIPTRITKNSTSCIDLAFANKKTETKVEVLKINDHSALSIELDFLSCKNSSNTKVEMRTWNNLNKKEVLPDVNYWLWNNCLEAGPSF